MNSNNKISDDPQNPRPIKSLHELISETYKYLIAKGIKKANVGIILGSGMSAISSNFNKILSIPYDDIPHLTGTKIKSHKGELIYAESGGKLLLIFAGRIHYYEGHEMWQVAYSVRILHAMGVQTLLTTGAAGGLNPNYKEGDIVLLTDHINLMPDNPLRGPNDERLGLRFPDMSEPYSLAHIAAIKKVAHESKILIHTGVYVGLPGPSLETRAEYNYLHIIGGDLVAMSIVPEVIAAVHAGIDVVGLCIVSNICYPPEKITETTIDEVINSVNISTGAVSDMLLKWLLA